MCVLCLTASLDYSRPVGMAKQECKTRIIRSLETIGENAIDEVVRSDKFDALPTELRSGHKVHFGGTRTHGRRGDVVQSGSQSCAVGDEVLVRRFLLSYSRTFVRRRGSNPRPRRIATRSHHVV
ncbi:hypothetical protein LF1_05220 [Rubripirellula obstinata]|uniref:Uncharacterized protein n=1 Tax=Rubripirellula obstinata TaxID=406547 RepID=A0A5B1CCR9_9BACT|nr:hypothetical protein LF1_05220 [Rubripirellula obstinata]